MASVHSTVLYLDLMKKCLTNTIYADPELVPVAPRGLLRRWVVEVFGAVGLTLARVKQA